MSIFPSHYWHNLSREKVLEIIQSSPEGLSNSEAEFRKQKYGANDVVIGKKHGVLSIFVRQFRSPLISILVFAGILSFVLGDKVDAFIIFGAVVLNALIGFFEEFRVSKILDELTKYVTYNAIVIRKGVKTTISTKDITIGDVILLRQGDKVPADARILSSSNLKINEVSLSGESMPVEKNHDAKIEIDTPVADRENMVFMGTTVEEGLCHAVVVAIDNATEFGKIAELVQESSEDSPLQNKMDKLGKFLGILFVSISAILFLIGYIRGESAVSMFLIAVAVAVAAIPESLPIALSATLAVGAKRILNEGGLMRKIIGAEALGNTTVIASDKTATLTEGKMNLVSIISGDMSQIEEEFFFDIVEKDNNSPVFVSFKLATLANNATIGLEVDPQNDGSPLIYGRPIDRAIFSSMRDVGLLRHELEMEFPRISEIPFNSKNKFSAILTELRKENNIFPDEKLSNLVTVVGAPEVILESSSSFYNNNKEEEIISDQLKDEYYKKIDSLTGNGFKVLGISYKKIPKSKNEINFEDINNLVFLSFLIFSDPIRKDVKEAIETAQKAGLRVVMITGDHEMTARYVAYKVGIINENSSDRIISGNNIPDNLVDVIDQYDVFARISPEDKLNIVNAFKKKGEVIAVMGDGINDAPALINADLGVAVGSGTDVAKEASDLILLDDNFRIIVHAIKQGRIIYDNIKKTLMFLLITGFSEIILVGGSIIAGFPLALLPGHILWANIAIDGLPAISLAFEPEEGTVMHRKPEKESNLITKPMRNTIIFFSLITDVFLLLIFFVTYHFSGDLDYSRTIVFSGLVLKSLFIIFSIRSLRKPIWKRSIFGNKFLLLSVLAGVLMYLGAIYVPVLKELLDTTSLSGRDFVILLIFGLFNIVVLEYGKKKYLGVLF